jgi:hypothetical protein
MKCTGGMLFLTRADMKCTGGYFSSQFKDCSPLLSLYCFGVAEHKTGSTVMSLYCHFVVLESVAVLCHFIYLLLTTFRICLQLKKRRNTQKWNS